MLSLIYKGFQSALNYVYSNETAKEDIDEVISRIECEKEINTDIPVKETEVLKEEGYYYKTGTVTQITADFILIDDIYIYEKIDNSTDNLNIGDKVQYLLYLQDSKAKPKVRNIICTIDDSWNNSNVKTKDNGHVQTISKSIIAKVIKREGRCAIVEPNNIRINLHKIHSDFVPIIGDWLILESLVELNFDSADSNDEVLEINRIKPLRSKLDVGVISKYNSDTQVGVIDKQIVFHKHVCDRGYIPCVGDQVVSDSIESDQGQYNWRSVSLVSLKVSNKSIQLPNVNNIPSISEFNNLLTNKYGIIIDDKLNFNLNIGEESTLKVSIQNNGSYAHLLQSGSFMSQNSLSQLSIISPINTNTGIIIYPSESFIYTFKCKAKFVGTSEELFTFNFKDFKIARVFHIVVKTKNILQKDVPTLIKQKNIKDNLFDLNDLIEITCIPGIRPMKPPQFIKVRNGVFKVPKYIWTVVLDVIQSKISQTERELSIGNKIPCLLKPLSFEIYKERFHILLYLEEITITLFLRQYDMDNVVMRRSGDYLALEVPGLAEKRPSLLIGDKAIISFPWDSSQENLKYEGFIHKVKRTEIFLKFNQKFQHDYNGEKCQVIFKNSYTVIQRSHNAINLALNRLGPDFLFPTKVTEKEPQFYLEEYEVEDESSIQIIQNESNNLNFSTSKNNTATVMPNGLSAHSNNELEPYITQIKKRKLNWFNKKLNYHQKEAVKNIILGLARPLPYIIFGPPGTGKTVTLCETILQLLSVIPESRLLVATPSNSSANLIVERLLDSNILKPGDLVRLIAHHCLESESIPDRLLPYCATAELAEEGTLDRFCHQENGLRLNCTMSILGRHRITIGTCSTLGILHNMGFPRGHFSHVLVDEAGQATEPEIMIPLNFIHSDNGQVILAGDPMQLGPVVQSKLATYYGLGESFLSRLLHQFPYQKDPEGFKTGYDPRLVTKLKMNYRNLPKILDLPNSLFYESELQPQISSKNSKEAKLLEMLREELPEKDGSPSPIIFHGVNGENYQDSERPSWYNPEEATQVYLYLLRLYKYGLKPDDIGIITPYLKQVMQIQDLLLELDLPLPKISTVEGFQGQERNVIIISTVRSSKNFIDEDIKFALGFVASPKRLNVAISRARALLIIIGNPKLLALDPYWRSTLMYCIENGGYTGCNFLPSYTTNVQNNIS